MLSVPYIQDFWPKWLNLSKLDRTKEVTDKCGPKVACGEEEIDPIGVTSCRGNAEAAYALFSRVDACGRREQKKFELNFVPFKTLKLVTKEKQIWETGFHARRNTYLHSVVPKTE